MTVLVRGGAAPVDENRQQVRLAAPLVRREPNGALLVFDGALQFVNVEGPALSHLGFSRETVGRSLHELARPHVDAAEPRLSHANLPAAEALLRSVIEGAAYEFQIVRGDCVFLVRLAPMPGENGARLGLATLFDITDQHRETLSLRQANEQLRAESLTDTLTGLLNRRGFITHAEHALAHAAQALALFFIDLNGLKVINDQLGHEVGDLALRDTARVLCDTFREVDIVARLGGDEFVVLVRCEAPELLTARLAARVAAQNATSLREFALSLSVGTATYDPTAPKSLAALLAEADAAMYERKRAHVRVASLQSPKQFA